MPFSDQPFCQNCGATLQGRYCHACGQKVLEQKDRTIGHFLMQFLGAAFFLENNVVKNLWTLLTKPGKLPLDFIEGRRKRWMPPFSLFFLINLVYFWYSPLTDFNLSLQEQLNQPHHRWFANELVSSKLAALGIAFDDYASIYKAKSTSYANTLIILHVPILAALLSLVFARRKMYYADHFLFALYFMAFMLLISVLQVLFLHVLGNFLHVDADIAWPISTLLYLALILVYIFVSLRRTYSLTTLPAALYAFPFLIAFILTHFIYRTLLFLIILAVT